MSRSTDNSPRGRDRPASVVLITGASSGVGKSAARLFSQRGYKVFGTSRNPASAESIPDVEMLPLDVRADESAMACVEAVSSRTGRIDVLINNSGYELAGALEKFASPLKDAKTLPISCLFPAPTGGNARSIGATTGNPQLLGRKEDKLESAIVSKDRQDAANHLRFGC